MMTAWAIVILLKDAGDRMNRGSAGYPPVFAMPDFAMSRGRRSGVPPSIIPRLTIRLDLTHL